MTRALNLDKSFTPTPYQEIEYEKFVFNGGEVNIKIKSAPGGVYGGIAITHRIKTSDNLMEVLLAKDAIENMFGNIPVTLFIPYLPYARQDRVCSNGEALSMKVFANIINNANFHRVVVLDAHSDVGPALLDRCENISNRNYVIDATYSIGGGDDLLLVSPDAGAAKKCNMLYTSQSTSNRFGGLVQCGKVRNPNTGELSGFEVYADDLEGKRCLIVDDICDGGGTFIGLAKELKKKNAGELYLFVTHGIFSKGIDELKKHFDRIYCTDSFSTIKSNTDIRQFEIEMK